MKLSNKDGEKLSHTPKQNREEVSTFGLYTRNREKLTTSNASKCALSMSMEENQPHKMYKGWLQVIKIEKSCHIYQSRIEKKCPPLGYTLGVEKK